jgi:hypothetical protein
VSLRDAAASAFPGDTHQVTSRLAVVAAAATAKAAA